MHYVVGSLSATHAKHMRIHCECHFHMIYHIPYSIYHIPKWSHWPIHHEYFFRKTALADPILTLDVGFQLFWAAFDLLVTVVPLKVALGLEKFGYFWYMVYGIWYVVYHMKMAFTVYSHILHMHHAQVVYNIVHLFLVFVTIRCIYCNNVVNHTIRRC